LKEFGAGNRRPQNPKELFNHCHALLKNHVEQTLGVLKKRFPILKVATFHTLENQVKIPMDVAIFHNLIRSLHGDEEWLDHQPDVIDPKQFVSLPDGDEINYPGTAEGNTLRDAIAQENTLGVRYYRTDRFGSSVPRLIRFLKNSGPIGSTKDSVSKVFGIGSFDSVSVFTKNTEPQVHNSNKLIN
jgi:hypothetical protein